LRFELTAGVGASREARRRVAARWRGHPRLDELLVALSEVVTNAVVHARAPVSVRVATVADGRVRVEVGDGSPALPHRRHFGPESAAGRGLFLLDRFTEAWGVSPANDGKVVWFEVAGPGLKP
jgi:anti-sigma regulatory factor (Ser/Thr protein kinase)